MFFVFIAFFVAIFSVTTSVIGKDTVFDHPIQENTLPLELKNLSDRFERFQSIRTRFVQTKKISVLKHLDKKLFFYRMRAFLILEFTYVNLPMEIRKKREVI